MNTLSYRIPVGRYGTFRNRLPACLSDAGDHARERQLPEADPAQSELPQVGTRAAAALAAVMLPHRELRLPLALLDHGLTSHRRTLFKVNKSDEWVSVSESVS